MINAAWLCTKDKDRHSKELGDMFWGEKTEQRRKCQWNAYEWVRNNEGSLVGMEYLCWKVVTNEFGWNMY